MAWYPAPIPGCPGSTISVGKRPFLLRRFGKALLPQHCIAHSFYHSTTLTAFMQKWNCEKCWKIIRKRRCLPSFSRAADLHDLQERIRNSEEAYWLCVNQYASSSFFVVQWTIPPYSVFRDSASSISTSVPFHFFVSMYCNVLNFRNALRLVYSSTLIFILQLTMLSCFFDGRYVSSLYCKFIITPLFRFVKPFLWFSLNIFIIIFVRYYCLNILPFLSHSNFTADKSLIFSHFSGRLQSNTPLQATGYHIPTWLIAPGDKRHTIPYSL